MWSWCKHVVYKIHGNGKGIGPICERHGCMRTKGETCFDNMAMMMFRNTIVFRSVGLCGKVRDTISG